MSLLGNIRTGAPCEFEVWVRSKGEYQYEHPNVKCTGRCADCGFNRAVQNRRLSNGRFIKHEVTHVWHDDEGYVLDTITNTVKTLHFRKDY